MSDQLVIDGQMVEERDPIGMCLSNPPVRHSIRVAITYEQHSCNANGGLLKHIPAEYYGYLRF